MRGSVPKPAPNETGINPVNGYIHQYVERTPITQSFTSNRNVAYIQDQLWRGIYFATGVRTGPQPIQAIAYYMGNAYINSGPYAVYEPDREVERLNRLVLQKLIHDAVQTLEANTRFWQDQNTAAVGPDRPMATSSKGSRQTEINYFI